MYPLIKTIVALAFVLCALRSSVARADVPPIDACTSPGASCENAGPGGNLPGICTVDTCTRPIGPPSAAGAAGSDVISYECLRCKKGSLGEAGAGGTHGEAGSGNVGGEGGVTGAGGTSGEGGANGEGGAGASGGSHGGGDDDGGCSCNLTALGSERGVAALMLGLGALGNGRSQNPGDLRFSKPRPPRRAGDLHFSV
jgi:hypothetical protein